MPAAGLIEMPPVSKVTPLPTKATGCLSAAAGIAVVLHDDQIRLLDAALRHAEDGAHAELGHLLLVEHLDLDADFGQLAAALGEGAGEDDVGGFRHDVAGQEDAAGERLALGEDVLGGGRIAGQDGDRLEGRLGFRLFLGAVLVEAVGAEERPEGDLRRDLSGRQAAAGQIVDHDGHFRRILAQRRHNGATGILYRGVLDLVGLAETDQEDVVQVDAAGGDDGQGFIGLAGKLVGGHGAGQDAAGSGVQVGPGFRQRPIGQNRKGDRAGLGQRQIGEREFHVYPLGLS